MAIQYDKLNEAKATLRSFREAYLDGEITLEELQAVEVKIKQDIRVILGYEPPEEE